MTDLQRLSQGGFQCARDCKRKFQYRYEMGLQRRGGDDSDALNFGRLWHKVAAEYDIRQTMIYMVEYIMGLDSSQDNKTRVASMLYGYANRWPGFDFMALQEQEIEVSIRNPSTGRLSQRFSQYGFLDKLALRHDGSIWLHERKTAATIGGGYIEKLFSDSQITGYYAALRDMGIDVQGVVYDVALKPKLRQKKTETEADFYGRIREWHMQPEAYHMEEMYVSDRQVQDWREDVWMVTQEILAARRAGMWPRNTGRCFDYYRQCEYLSLCQNGAPQVLIDSEYELRETPSNSDNQTEAKPIF